MPLTVPDDMMPPLPCEAFRVRAKNVFTGPREARGLHEFRIHCIHEFGHSGDHTDPTGRTW